MQTMTFYDEVELCDMDECDVVEWDDLAAVGGKAEDNEAMAPDAAVGEKSARQGATEAKSTVPGNVTDPALSRSHRPICEDDDLSKLFAHGGEVHPPPCHAGPPKSSGRQGYAMQCRCGDVFLLSAVEAAASLRQAVVPCRGCSNLLLVHTRSN
jgi:hypothetical protein